MILHKVIFFQYPFSRFSGVGYFILSNHQLTVCLTVSNHILYGTLFTSSFIFNITHTSYSIYMSISYTYILTAIFFVTTVCTFGSARTVEESGNASVVPTTKLVGPARGIVAPERGLVGSVGTVYATVANPRLYNTMAVVFAFELVGSAFGQSSDFRATLQNNRLQQTINKCVIISGYSEYFLNIFKKYFNQVRVERLLKVYSEGLIIIIKVRQLHYVFILLYCHFPGFTKTNINIFVSRIIVLSYYKYNDFSFNQSRETFPFCFVYEHYYYIIQNARMIF